MYVFVIFVMRCMGKRQIGQLQPYEFVLALMISDLAALPMQDSAIPLWSGVIPILSLLLMQLTISILILKSRTLRNLLCGKPCIMIKNGSILEKNLRDQMYNIDDLLEALRLKGYPDVHNILLAILENNGDLSVLPYARAGTVTRDDLDIVTSEDFIMDLVIDGLVLSENMKVAGIDQKILEEEIKKAGGRSVKDVFYCYLNGKGNFSTQLKEKVSLIRMEK